MPEDSELRVTPFTIQAGAAVGNIRELETSGIVSMFLVEALAWGTGAGEVSIAFGDQGDFMDLSPGDSFINFSPVRRVRLRNNTVTDKTVVFLLTTNPDFRFWNTPRGF